ncbi:MAG: hypothetical protein KGM98_09565 [Bacteroidota bacterium]|nr:hypothetical protein [Bacteroidota bacterium]
MLSRSSDWQNGVGFAQHATSGICTGPPVGCIKKKVKFGHQRHFNNTLSV